MPESPERAPEAAARRRPLLLTLSLLALVVLGAALAYRPALHSPFTFDDLRNISENPNVRMRQVDADSVLRAMTPPRNLNLRPLTFLTFALNHRFGGEEPYGYHLVNLAILLLSIGVAFLLARALASHWLAPGEADVLALATTALWALHPLLTNGVTYVVQRMTSLYTLLAMASLLLVLRAHARARPLWRVPALLLWLLAVAAKDTALYLPLLALLCFAYLLPLGSAARARAGWWLAGGIAASQIATLAVAGLMVQRGWIPPPSFSSLERLLTEGRVVLRYLGLFLLPLPSRMHLDYDFPLSASLLVPPATLVAIAVHAAALAGAFLLRRRRPLLSLGIAAFYLWQLPEGTFLPIDVIFEHRVYFPAFFLALALADALRWASEAARAPRPGAVALAAALALAAWWGTLTHQRNLMWADPVRLWGDVVRNAPNLERARMNLGLLLLRAGRDEEAGEQFRELVRLDPANPGAHTNLGIVQRNLGRSDEALRSLEAALEVKADFPEAHLQLGVTYGMLGRDREGVEALRRAVALRPWYPEAHANLGALLGKLGLLDEAAAAFEQALAHRPGYDTARYNLGLTRLRQGRETDASRHAAQLARSSPSLAAALRREIDAAGRLRPGRGRR